MPNIVLSNFYSDLLLKEIQKAVPSGFKIIPLTESTKENLLANMPEADYLLAGGRIQIDEQVLSAAPNLKMIQRTGVGLDSFDLEALIKRNIPLYVNQGINARSVAEHTVMLMFSVMKNVVTINQTLKQGIWKKHEFGIQNHELCGKTVGLVGLGRIGTLVAKMLQPFDVRLLYNEINPLNKQTENELNIQFAKLAELLKVSDIVSLHCSLNDSTLHLLNETSFSMMKEGAVLINTSRGKLIDEKALVSALRNGKIKAAGLDVYEQEPFSKDNELLRLKNVILSPHISGITNESFMGMIRNAFENIVAYEQEDFEKIEHKKVNYG